MSLFWTAALLCCHFTAAFSQTSNPLAADPKAAEAGLSIYRRHCSSCHGNQADGGRAPALTRGSLSEPDLFRKISGGVSGTEMAAYSGRLSTDEIWRIVSFVRSATGGASPTGGNPARGETLFWEKGGCGQCHTVGNRGSLVGPDLSRIGVQRNPVHLRESLVAPDADIARGFDGVTVVTREGKTIRGLERAVDDFSVVFVDFAGKVYSFDRANLRSVVRETKSLMPAAGQSLSSTELGDVLAYLATLSGRKPEVSKP